MIKDLAVLGIRDHRGQLSGCWEIGKEDVLYFRDDKTAKRTHGWTGVQAVFQ